MTKDISDILGGWDYEPGKISVRRIRGSDGRPKIQLRLDLGLLQMDTTGRPDGRRPHGCESLLHYYRRKLRHHRLAHGSEEGFTLGADECEQLQAESVMYYHRYLSEFALGDYDAVIRDTGRNLAVLDLCGRFADTDGSRLAMERYRPYILMMHTRARAMRAMARDDYAGARRVTEDGLKKMRSHARRFDRAEAIEESGAAAVLKVLLEEIERREPVDPIEAMVQKLELAVEEERYEDAARLRDELRVLRGRIGPERPK